MELNMRWIRSSRSIAENAINGDEFEMAVDIFNIFFNVPLLGMKLHLANRICQAQLGAKRGTR